MNEYRLGALLRLRQNRMDGARRELHTSAAAVQDAVRERQQLIAEAERRRVRATEPYPESGYRTSLWPMRSREQWRGVVDTIRRQLEVEAVRLQRAQGKEREAVRALDEARAAREALEGHRRRWIEARRAELESAEEREVDDWFNGCYVRRNR